MFKSYKFINNKEFYLISYSPRYKKYVQGSARGWLPREATFQLVEHVIGEFEM